MSISKFRSDPLLNIQRFWGFPHLFSPMISNMSSYVSAAPFCTRKLMKKRATYYLAYLSSTMMLPQANWEPLGTTGNLGESSPNSDNRFSTRNNHSNSARFMDNVPWFSHVYFHAFPHCHIYIPIDFRTKIAPIDIPIVKFRFQRFSAKTMELSIDLVPRFPPKPTKTTATGPARHRAGVVLRRQSGHARSDARKQPPLLRAARWKVFIRHFVDGWFQLYDGNI